MHEFVFVHQNIIIPVPLSQAVIKCNFPSFQLERIVIPVCYNTHVQTRDGSWMSEPGFVTRDMRRIRHSDTQSLSRDHKPRNPLPSQPCHGDTTQLRSGKWYLSIMGHGLTGVAGMHCRLEEQCQACPATIIQSSILCHCVRRYESLRWHRIYHC